MQLAASSAGGQLDDEILKRLCVSGLCHGHRIQRREYSATHANYATN